MIKNKKVVALFEFRTKDELWPLIPQTDPYPQQVYMHFWWGTQSLLQWKHERKIIMAIWENQINNKWQETESL